MNNKKFSDDEAREILKRAVAYQERDDFHYTNDQLFDIGREMGLSQDAIVKAAQDVAVGRETPVSGARRPVAAFAETPTGVLAEEEKLFRRERMRDFYVHLAVYICIVTLCLVINLISGLQLPWFLFVVLGWGTGIIGHYAASARHEGEEYEKAFDEWLESREEAVKRRQKRVQRLERN
jgi:hypothetical protein